jgi:hypothetical protein
MDGFLIYCRQPVPNNDSSEYSADPDRGSCGLYLDLEVSSAGLDCDANRWDVPDGGGFCSLDDRAFSA